MKCRHQEKSARLAEVITDLAGEIETAQEQDLPQLQADLEHSTAMTRLAMEWNHQDHERECS